MSYEGDYIIIGPPGTGKTRRVARSVEKILKDYAQFGRTIKTPVVVCSLTRTAAAEAAGRTGLSRDAVGTMHAHAYRALGHPTMVSGENLGDWNKIHPSWSLKGSADESGDVEPEAGGSSPGEELYRKYQEARACGSPISGPVRRFADAWNEWKRDADLSDFTDLIENCIQSEVKLPGDPKVVIADEAQDMSAAEFKLLRQWGAAAGATIMVGDPWQSLYDWRGADADFLQRHPVPEGHRDVLSQSYRVPKAVHHAATRFVRGLSEWQEIDYKPTEVEGWTDRLPTGGWRAPEPAIAAALKHLEEGKSVMILATCGYMLFPTVKTLRSMGIPFSNPWRVARGDWNPLNTSGTSMAQRFLGFLSFSGGLKMGQWQSGPLCDWLKVMDSRGTLAHGAKQRVEGMAASDERPLPFAEVVSLFRPEAWTTLTDAFLEWQRNDLRTAMPGLQKWFNDHLLKSKRAASKYPLDVALKQGPRSLMDEPKLHVGTIHSFKGAEADVVIMYPDISNAGAKQWQSRKGKDSLIRTIYVGLTRAKEGVLLSPASGTQSVASILR